MPLDQKPFGPCIIHGEPGFFSSRLAAPPSSTRLRLTLCTRHVDLWGHKSLPKCFFFFWSLSLWLLLFFLNKAFNMSGGGGEQKVELAICVYVPVSGFQTSGSSRLFLNSVLNDALKKLECLWRWNVAVSRSGSGTECVFSSAAWLIDTELLNKQKHSLEPKVFLLLFCFGLCCFFFLLSSSSTVNPYERQSKNFFSFIHCQTLKEARIF